MLILPLVWLALGACIGALAIPAGWTPARWGRHVWWAAPALGAFAALIGGWISTLLLDRIFATLMALCVSVAVITMAALLARQRWSRHAG